MHRRRSLALVFLLLLAPLFAETTGQRVVVRIEAGRVQQTFDRDSRTAFEAPLLLTPQFEVVEPASGVRSGLKVLPGGIWVAELEVPAPTNARNLQRLAFVPFSSAGPDAVRAIARLQESWSKEDPWPLVHGVLAWGWGPRDPRFVAKSGILTLNYPIR